MDQPPNRAYNILVLHAYHYEYPPRATSRDWLYSFRRYGGQRCFYWNVYYFSEPSFIRAIKWDLIIFTDLFVVERWNLARFDTLLKKIESLKHISATKALVAQDEFIYSAALCKLVNEFDIGFVFTCAKQADWEKIYEDVNFEKVKFQTVLTGYLDESTLARIAKLALRENPDRSIDVGYRSKKVPPSLGRHGLLKSTVADVFRAKAPEKGFKIDISLLPRDTFLGDDWYRFLLRCKYFIGVEGGASILDKYGYFRRAADLYLETHPGAEYAEIEVACFPGQDGTLGLKAISPRHLEACATRTCQILIEGNYNEILQPGKHYIELKQDFSNLDQVLETLKDENLRWKIVEQAYQDIVQSGLYTYRNFVSSIFTPTLAGQRKSPANFQIAFALIQSYILDMLGWAILATWALFLRNPLRGIQAALPHVWGLKMKKIFRKFNKDF
jgi:hypothetical protein